MKHLLESVKAICSQSDEERIQFAYRQKWIGYKRANEILEALENLYNQPKRDRMPNALLVGDTNNGKTSIISRFVSKHPPRDNPEEDNVWLPIMVVQSPPNPDESGFYNEILVKLGAMVKLRDHPRNKRFQTIQILKQTGTKMLIIDEFHHLIAGDLRRQQVLLNSIKFLGNELQIPIVAAGIEDSFNALQIDRQLSNRFQPLPIYKWNLDKSFRSLLLGFEKLLPLKKPSGLAGMKLARVILSMSEGTIGGVSDLLCRATDKAIKTKKEKIDMEILESINWIPPSEMKKKALRRI